MNLTNYYKNRLKTITQNHVSIALGPLAIPLIINPTRRHRLSQPKPTCKLI